MWRVSVREGPQNGAGQHLLPLCRGCPVGGCLFQRAERLRGTVALPQGSTAVCEPVRTWVAAERGLVALAWRRGGVTAGLGGGCWSRKAAPKQLDGVAVPRGNSVGEHSCLGLERGLQHSDAEGHGEPAPSPGSLQSA